MKIISVNNGLRVLLYSVILASLPISAFARAHASPSGAAFFQQTVSGTVSDATGPLPGAIIMVKGTTRSTISDSDGKFSMTAHSGEVLMYSFTGYKTVEVMVAANTNFNVIMEEDSTQLEELTINAGYYNVKQKEATGSIARITAKEIENQPVTNVLATMQGRMAGVSITQTTGVPGGGFDIAIRGQNSIRPEGNIPLYIIDGVPYSAEGMGSSYTGDVLPGAISPLNSINPDNIASIEILKDADATAIYGSRGANEVILITTKKGKEGRTSFSSKFTTGLGTITRKWKLLRTADYLAMRHQAFANDGATPGPVDYDVNGTWDQNRNTDWQDHFIGNTAVYTDRSLSATGGNAYTQFLLSANHRKETTVFPGDFNYKRTNVFASLSHESEDRRFKLSFSGSYTLQDNLQPSSDITRDILFLAPNAPSLYNSQGEWNWENSTWVNPLSLLKPLYRSATNDLVSNLTFSYNLGKGFTAKTNLGFSDTRFQDSSTVPSDMFNPDFGIGSESSSIFVNNNTRRSWIFEPQLNWEYSLAEFKTQILVGGTFQQQISTQLIQEAIGFSNDSQIYNLSAANFKSVTADNETQYKYNAAYARVNFSLKNRYILNITGRRDGSSRFGPGRQFANFGAIGTAWIFSDEPLLKKNDFISYGKLRASYGTTGSDQIGDYQFIDSYSITGNSYNGTPGLEPTRLYNANFGWETNKKMEFALETGFLKDRILFSAAYFSNRSSSQLVGVPLPGTTGFTSIQANLDATVQNTGLEFTLRTENIKTQGPNWTSAINLSILKNKLSRFPELQGSTYRNRYIIGQPLNIAKVYKYEGIDPETGLYTFKDFNGDGEISTAEDRQHAVDLNPSFFGGFQNTFSYKGWQLDFLFQFVKQRNYNANYSFDMPGTFSNQPDNVLNALQQPQGDGTFQRYSTGIDNLATDAFDKYRNSDALITDASFIRLKNVSVSYTIPSNWLNRVSVRIFAEGQNLFVITPYTGADPESRYTSNLPPLKMFTGGIQLNF